MRILIFAVALVLSGCNSRISGGGGDVDVPGADWSFGGWIEGEMKFVVLSNHDWMNSASRSGSRHLDGDDVMKTWRTFAEPREGTPWEFLVDLRKKRQEVTFKGTTFDLAKGEVFVLSPNLSVTQINEKAGPRADAANMARLSAIFDKHKSEQLVSPNGP